MSTHPNKGDLTMQDQVEYYRFPLLMEDCRINGAASELFKNETMHVGLVQCMAIRNPAGEEILFTDSLRGSVDVLNKKTGNI